MKEYIEREAVMQAFAVYVWNSNHSDLVPAPQWNNAVDIVSDLPAADVVEVRHGRWEPGNPICPVCGGDKFKDLDADIWCDWMPDFCPNCGAKMDGGAETGGDNP